MASSHTTGPGSSHQESEPELEPPRSTVEQDRRYEAYREFSLERYKYILQQVHATNENIYKFLTIYQALASTTVGAAVALFVGYKRWDLSPSIARTGVLGLIALETIIAIFTIMMILIGILTWLDYRTEECDLTDDIVGIGFRKRPNVRNFFRWYETYILAFITASTIFLWIATLNYILPSMR